MTSVICPQSRKVYVVDRMAGTITFAPALHLPDEKGHLDPKANRWRTFRKPAGKSESGIARAAVLAGNVAENTLTTLKDPIPGVSGQKSQSGGRRKRCGDTGECARAWSAGVAFPAACGDGPRL